MWPIQQCDPNLKQEKCITEANLPFVKGQENIKMDGWQEQMHNTMASFTKEILSRIMLTCYSLCCGVQKNQVEIWCSRAPVLLLVWKKNLRVSKNIEKNQGCRKKCIPQPGKISTSNTLYFELHKNDKSVDLSIHIFKSPNFIRFVIFV